MRRGMSQRTGSGGGSWFHMCDTSKQNNTGNAPEFVGIGESNFKLSYIEFVVVGVCACLACLLAIEGKHSEHKRWVR